MGESIDPLAFEARHRDYMVGTDRRAFSGLEALAVEPDRVAVAVFDLAVLEELDDDLTRVWPEHLEWTTLARDHHDSRRSSARGETRTGKECQFVERERPAWPVANRYAETFEVASTSLGDDS